MFVELSEYQKLNFSIFSVLTGKFKNQKRFKGHSKPSNLVRQSLSKKFQQRPIFFIWFPWNPLCPSFEQQYLENGESNHCLHKNVLQEYLISFLMIFRVTEFELVAL